jgi:hypothetical protein
MDLHGIAWYVDLYIHVSIVSLDVKDLKNKWTFSFPWK